MEFKVHDNDMSTKSLINKGFKDNRRFVMASYYSFLFVSIYYFIFYIGGGFAGRGIGGVLSVDFFFPLLYIAIGYNVYVFVKSKWKHKMPLKGYFFYVLLLLCNLICIIRGCINASGYYDWKFIFVNFTGGTSYFVPLAMVIGINYLYTSKIFKFSAKIVKIGLPFIPFISYSLNAEINWNIYAQIETSVLFLLLFFPLIIKKGKIIIIITVIVSILSSLNWRTNFIRLVSSFFIMLSFYFKKFFSYKILIATHCFIFILPFFLLASSLFTGKSFFEKSNDYNSDGRNDDIIADTRTFLYVEVLSDLSNTNNLIWGKGITGKYKSEFFNEKLEAAGRSGSEVGFLNTLLYTGIIGVLLNFVVLFLAVYYATKKSNNFTCKVLSLYVSTYWLLLFIENFNKYDIYIFFTWIIIGLCFSKQFRNLSDFQIKSFLLKSINSKTLSFRLIKIFDR